MATAWDELLDAVDHLAADPGGALDHSAEERLVVGITRAVDEGDVDRELHVDDTARWLTAMLVAHRAVREQHPEVSADRELALLRLIVTRWLHPHRLDQRASEPRT